MKTTTMRVLVLSATVGAAGCAVVPRPLAFGRPAVIKGKVALADERGTVVPAAKLDGVTINFINTSGRIEESVLSVTSDAIGRYRSPKLLPGEYKVEAFLPGHVVETATLRLRKHEQKTTPFVLKKIKESQGRSIRESDEDNIPNPGDVQIAPPGL